MSQTPPKVSIIGAGTVGSTITMALHAKGYPIVSVINRTGKKAIVLAKNVGCKKASTCIGDLSPATQTLIIAVSDDAIIKTVKEIALTKRLKFRNMFAFHLSGVFSSEVLLPLKRKGADVAAVHPIQTFPKGEKHANPFTKLRGICYGIDGEGRSVERANDLVSTIEGKSIVIPPDLKPLYHIACVFASNYLMVHLTTLAELTKQLHVTAPWMEIFGPLMTASMENIIRKPVGQVLTGPIIRGDVATIEKHLEALDRFAPQVFPLYCVEGIELARIAKSNGRIDEETFRRLLSLFKSFIRRK